jgi:hypothetical protein
MACSSPTLTLLLLPTAYCLHTAGSGNVYSSNIAAVFEKLEEQSVGVFILCARTMCSYYVLTAKHIWSAP